MYKQEKITPYGKNRRKGEQVEEMFNHIAHSYDGLNHSLSLGIDRRWRRLAVDSLKPYAPQRILDVATGTGDLALLLAKRIKPREILGVDLSDGMMAVARKKVADQHLDHVIRFQREDCTALSLDSEIFDAVTVAYGVRNFEDLDAGLREMHRVLKPNGHLVILELSTPHRAPMKQLFQLYSRVVMPTLGRIISHDNSAYTYLPQSMAAFPQAETVCTILERIGFRAVTFRRLTFGICTLFIANK